MLSRVAERVYWQARYLERAENTARMLNVFSTLLLDLPPRTKLGWHSLVEITGTYQAFDAKYKQASERNVMRFLLVDNNGHSRSEEHTSELQSRRNLVCRLLLEKKNK